jgi:uncharacterized protein (DUF2062 family)
MKKNYLRLVRLAYRSLRHPHLRDRPWWQAFVRKITDRQLWIPCRDTVASGLAIGLFFSMVPVVPQSILAAALAMRVRANVAVAIASCFFSNPFTNVPIWIVQIRLGQWCLDTFPLPVPHFLEKVHTTLPGIGPASVAGFIVGFMATGVLLALSAFPLVHMFSRLMPHHLPVRTRHQRSEARRLHRRTDPA